MSTRYKSVLLFGAPGVGKGTQGKLLGAVPGFHHLACGDVFRSLDRSSELGKKFMAYSTKGELVPDNLTVEMWKANMGEREGQGRYNAAQDLLVLDGIPRNVVQAKALEPYVDVLAVVHLTCKDVDAMVARMRGRAFKESRMDDADEKVIRRRFDVYDKETSPVLAHYPKQLVHDVDAVGTPALILERVLHVVAPIQASHFKNPLGG